MSAIAKGISKLFKPSKVRKKATSTPTRKKSPATVAREMRQKATMGNKKALKGLQLEAQRKAKDAKRGVDKKKQAALKKKIKNKPAAKKRRQQGAQIDAIKKERKPNPRQRITGNEGQAITSKNKNPDAVFTSGDNKIVRGKSSSPSIRDNTTKAQKNRANKIVALEKKVREGTATSTEKTELKRLDKINRDDTSRAAKAGAFTRGTPARKAKLKSFLQRGGKVVNKRSGGSMKKGLDEASKSAKKREGTIKRGSKKDSSLPFNLFPDSLPYESYDKKDMISAKSGGKVEYKKHGGKVIKTNMSGDDVVRGCYD